MPCVPTGIASGSWQRAGRYKPLSSFYAKTPALANRGPAPRRLNLAAGWLNYSKIAALRARGQEMKIFGGVGVERKSLSPRYTPGASRDTRKPAAWPSGSAAETMRGRSGLKIVAIGPSIHTVGTSHCRADLRRPPAHRFTLRISATRRDTKHTRNHTKTQHGSLPRHIRLTFPSLSLFL